MPEQKQDQDQSLADPEQSQPGLPDFESEITGSAEHYFCYQQARVLAMRGVCDWVEFTFNYRRHCYSEPASVKPKDFRLIPHGKGKYIQSH